MSTSGPFACCRCSRIFACRCCRPTAFAAAAPIDPFDIPYSDAEDNDDDVEVGAVTKPREIGVSEVLSLPAGSKATTTKTGSSTSASSGGSSGGRTASHGYARQIEKAAKGTKVEGSESSGYRVMCQDPSEAAKCLGFPETSRVIGGKVVGGLKFRSGGHERKFLEEAGQSFYFPLMEEELSGARTEEIL